MVDQAALGGGKTRLKTLGTMAAGLALGAIAGLGQVPFSLVWPALGAMVAVVAVFDRTLSVKGAAALGWAFGTGFFGLSLFWITEPFQVDVERDGWMAPFALVGMAGGLALFWGLAFGLARRIGPGRLGIVALVVFWSVAELARAYVLTGFPWGLVGYIWSETPVIQWASIVGPHGVTVLTLTLVSGTVLAFGAARRTRAVAGVAAGLTIFLFVGFLLESGGKPGGDPRPIVRIVQPNAEQKLKWDPQYAPLFFARALELTAQAAEESPDLVVWPETSVPYSLDYAGEALERVSQAAGTAPVVFGIQRRDGARGFNSLVLMDGGGQIREIYDKYHLVPFGEYMPLGDLAARFGIYGMAARDGFGFSPGDGARLIEIEGLGKALPLICYEAIFPQDVSATETRPDYLLQITNDAWFGRSAGPQQHLAQARIRAIEQGIPMIRAANTGISAMIDGKGRVLASLPLGVDGKIDARLPAPLPPTLYSRTRDLPVFIVLMVAVGLLVVRRRRI